jgi:hypothetical protein
VKRTPLPPRRTSVRKVNPKRRKSEFARAYHSKARVEFVKSLPCVVPWPHFGSENAHVGNKGKGTGRKADYDQIVPMCAFHHRDVLHRIGKEAFTRGYDVNLDQAAAETERLWQESQSPEVET